MVTISLCMIVKNEEAVLSRCLDSVRDVVDEIIIVDTGSDDRTREIAKDYGAYVCEIPWKNNFSEARNISFSYASKEYCMWLDADDVLTEEEVKKLFQWKQDTDGKAEILMMKYAAGYDEKGKPTFAYYRERLVKRNLNPVWSGRVHEVIEAEGTVEYLDILVEHRSNKKEYSDRNLRIYQEMMQNREELSVRDQFYYARELFYHRKYGESVENFLKFLSLPGGFVENRTEACRFCAKACQQLGKNEMALEFLYRGLTYRVPTGEICCDIGEYFFDRCRWEQAAFWYENALRVPCDLKSGGFIQREFYEYIPCVQLSVCWYHLSDKKKASAYHKMAGFYKPYGKEYLQNVSYFA